MSGSLSSALRSYDRARSLIVEDNNLWKATLLSLWLHFSWWSLHMVNGQTNIHGLKIQHSVRTKNVDKKIKSRFSYNFSVETLSFSTADNPPWSSLYQEFLSELIKSSLELHCSKQKNMFMQPRWKRKLRFRYFVFYSSNVFMWSLQIKQALVMSLTS